MCKYNVGDNKSTAETLMRVLNNDSTLSCIYCARSYDEAKKLVHIWSEQKSEEMKETGYVKNMLKDHNIYVEDAVEVLSL